MATEIKDLRLGWAVKRIEHDRPRGGAVGSMRATGATAVAQPTVGGGGGGGRHPLFNHVLFQKQPRSAAWSKSKAKPGGASSSGKDVRKEAPAGGVGAGTQESRNRAMSVEEEKKGDTEMMKAGEAPEATRGVEQQSPCPPTSSRRRLPAERPCDPAVPLMEQLGKASRPVTGEPGEGAGVGTVTPEVRTAQQQQQQPKQSSVDVGEKGKVGSPAPAPAPSPVSAAPDQGISEFSKASTSAATTFTTTAGGAGAEPAGTQEAPPPPSPSETRENGAIKLPEGAAVPAPAPVAEEKTPVQVAPRQDASCSAAALSVPAQGRGKDLVSEEERVVGREDHGRSAEVGLAPNAGEVEEGGLRKRGVDAAGINGVQDKAKRLREQETRPVTVGTEGEACLEARDGVGSNGSGAGTRDISERRRERGDGQGRDCPVPASPVENVSNVAAAATAAPAPPNSSGDSPSIVSSPSRIGALNGLEDGSLTTEKKADVAPAASGAPAVGASAVSAIENVRTTTAAAASGGNTGESGKSNGSGEAFGSANGGGNASESGKTDGGNGNTGGREKSNGEGFGSENGGGNANGSGTTDVGSGNSNESGEGFGSENGVGNASGSGKTDGGSGNVDGSGKTASDSGKAGENKSSSLNGSTGGSGTSARESGGNSRGSGPGGRSLLPRAACPPPGGLGPGGGGRQIEDLCDVAAGNSTGAKTKRALNSAPGRAIAGESGYACRVTAEDGRSVEADAVIVTLPLGVLKAR